MFRQLLLGATALALLPAAAAAADLAKAFGARESVAQIDLSPDGKRIAYITPTSGASSALLITDLESGEHKRLTTASGTTESLDWCRFASDARSDMLAKIGAFLAQNGGR